MDRQGIRLVFEQISQYDKTVLLQSLEKGYYSLTSNTPVRGTLLGIQSRLFSSCQDYSTRTTTITTLFYSYGTIAIRKGN